jgi:transglutaminase-like putative cysteine protease
MTGWGDTRFALLRAGVSVMLIWVALPWFDAAQAAGSDGSLYRFASAARWVEPVTPEYDAPLPSGGVSDGTWNLLLDRQINFTADGDDYYQHSATKVISTSGVDERSQIDITVDPTFQTLTLNSIRVIRQGRAIDQQPVARITALAQETELRKRIYDGSYNINILLFDVRVGDVVEYEYTIHSKERIFPGQYSDRMSIGWSVPMRRQRLRLRSPANLDLLYRVDDQSVPTSRVHSGVRELNWEWHDLAAIPGDEDRPKWYSPWPHFEVTSSKDWSDVARRIAPLFRVSNPHTPMLMAAVKDIRNAGGTPAEQALRALQFVQEQIRYVSISIGPGAFTPTSPEQVLERRFGDCKDKSLLLATILRELGIEAQPALVNTRRGRVLDSILPTPYAFDHAIVHMKLGNDVYWLDGTTEKQFSPVSTNSVARFERSLVIDSATTGLTPIARPGPGANDKRSEVLVDMRAGFGKSAKLQITTFYAGRLADSEREELANETSSQRQSNYINYIVRYYPGAKVSAPITIHDDPSKNVVEVREYYDIDRPFIKNDRRRPEFFMQADEIYRYVDTLGSSVRRSPLAVSYPVRVRQTVRALLPQEWTVRNETVRIDNPAFRYESNVSYSKERGVPQVTLDYRYESLSDFVDVAALPKYLEDRKRAYDDLGYYIRPNTVTLAAPVRLRPLASVPRWVAQVSLFFAIWITFRFTFRWDPPAAKSEPDWPVGIRGWLLVLAFVVIISPLASFASLYRAARFLEVDRWNRIHETVPEPFKVWAPTILLVLAACGVFLLVAQVLLVYLFFTRRSSTPYAFITIQWAVAVYLAVILVFPIAVHLSAPLDNARLATELIGGVVRAGAYTAYLLLSKRVKATFVVRLAQSRAGLRVAAVPSQ